MSKLGDSVPASCPYWRRQGDHHLVGCEIDGVLCCGERDCDLNRKDPTGMFRKRLDERRQGRAAESMKPMELTPEDAEALEKSLREGTARPKIEIERLPEYEEGK